MRAPGLFAVPCPHAPTRDRSRRGAVGRTRLLTASFVEGVKQLDYRGDLISIRPRMRMNSPFAGVTAV